jgi:hypothetical protein
MLRVLAMVRARRKGSVWGCSGKMACSATRFFGRGLRMTHFSGVTYLVDDHKGQSTSERRGLGVQADPDRLFHTFDTDRLAPGILHIAITPKRDDA